MAEANNRTPVRGSRGPSCSNGRRAPQTPTSPMSPFLENSNSAALLAEESGLGLHVDEEWDNVLAEVNEIQVVPEDDTTLHTYTYNNIPIRFPYEAYQSQQQMMEKIIEGVTTGEHCLLESPTGTGKTAALLCALLAWQKDCYDRNDYCGSVIDAAVERLGGCSCGFIKDKERTTVTINKNKFGVPFLTATTITPKANPEDSSVLTETAASPSKTSACASPELFPAPDDEPTTPTKDFPSTPYHGTPVTPCKSNVPSPSTSCPGTPRTPGKTYAPSPSTFESPFKRFKLLEEGVETEERWLDNLCGYCVRKYVRDKSRPPRIYYCTRTHSQIAQVVQQLKNTVYKGTKMTILASREPTCVSNLVDKENSRYHSLSTQEKKDEPKLTVNDICASSRTKYYKLLREKDPKVIEELEKGVCDYFFTKFEQNKVLASYFTPFQQNGAFDLEEVKAEGVGCGKCPYYGCYAMHENADIIFCSYNFLIDPSLRSFTNIHYANSVVVFDEAHNIEDLCRGAFTLTLDVAFVDNTIKSCVNGLVRKAEEAQEVHVSPLTLKKLNEVWTALDNWTKWIRERGDELLASQPRYQFGRGNREEVQESYVGEKLMEVLEEMGLTAEKVRECLAKIGKPVMKKKDEHEDSMLDQEMEYYVDRRGERRPFVVSSKVGEYLQRLLQPLVLLCEKEQEGIGGVKDFKGYLTCKQNPFWWPGRKSTQTQTSDGTVTVVEAIPKFIYNFEIICLNPAVGFRALRNCTYSVIVASGTLTPLQSFAGELATKFGVTLQADHVIPRENVWAGVVGVGPTNQQLELTSRHQSDEMKQDEIGRVICQICETVPNGILIFFPSYAFRNKLMDRWRIYPLEEPVLDRISKKKLIFREESKDREMFRNDMMRYKEEVKGGPTWDGCILFAIFRGKISEGIDFADEQARAVITIGIPYSNAGAPSVVSKQEYNNMRLQQRERSRGNNLRDDQQLLSGFDWYKTQAYRAMNQGLGRCVRHSKDWGALIMIDLRLCQERNRVGISGWVRNSLVPSGRNFEQFIAKLGQFVQGKMKDQRRPHLSVEYEVEPEAEHYSEDDESTQVVNISDDSIPMEDVNTQQLSISFANGNGGDEEMMTQPVSSKDIHVNAVEGETVPVG